MNQELVRLPGLIDVHVHLRVPGGEHKEDFHSGSAAALAGGFTRIMAMPNTQPPLLSYEVWSKVQDQARRESLCDVLMYCGAVASSIKNLSVLSSHAPVLKVYLDPTYGNINIQQIDDLERIATAWPFDKPLCLHAEGKSIREGIGVAEKTGRHIHFCHVSRKEEIEWIAEGKARGLKITCEVTPHHLFLDHRDTQRLGPLGDMRPRLADPSDVAALWDHIGSTIDIIATDHAPHTLEEKAAIKPPPGVPGLESSLPLMATAVVEGRLSMARLVALMHTNPARIFHLTPQPETWVEIDLNSQYPFPEHPLYTKCGWTPFAGQHMHARVSRVVMAGTTIVENGLVNVEANPKSIQSIHSEEKK